MNYNQKEIEASITGYVQGVNFRKFIKKHADELSIRGFVKNMSDGSVEVVAQGEEDNLKDFINLLKKGPYFAEVEEVDVSWSSTTQDTLTDFSIAETI